MEFRDFFDFSNFSKLPQTIELFFWKRRSSSGAPVARATAPRSILQERAAAPTAAETIPGALQERPVALAEAHSAQERHTSVLWLLHAKRNE